MSKPRIPIPDNPSFWRRGSRVGFHFRDGHGKWRQATAATLAEAKALKRDVTTDVARGEYQPPSKMTFAAYATEWVDEYKGRRTAKIKPFTIKEYRRQLNQHVIPAIGQMKLSDVEPRDIKRLINGLEKKGLAPGTIRSVMAPVRALFADAWEEGVVRHNPARDVRMPVRDTSGRPKHLEPEEVRALVAAAPEDWRLFLRLLAYTGLRIGEAVELRWDDLDLGAAPTLTVSRRLYRGETDSPKSAYGVRTLPLTTELKAALIAHRLASARSGPEDYVFATCNGTAHSPRNLYRWFKEACRTAGLVGEDGNPWPGFHTLRHTAGTNLARAGRRPEEIQVWLGHHAPSFTLDTYIGIGIDPFSLTPGG